MPAPAAPELAELAGALELVAGLEAGLALDELDAALEVVVVEVVVVGVVVVAVVVVRGAAASVEVGIVSGGASALSGAGVALPPQPPMASTEAAINAAGIKRGPPLAMSE